MICMGMKKAVENIETWSQLLEGQSTTYLEATQHQLLKNHQHVLLGNKPLSWLR
jgi:hypothetical protein